MMRYLSCRWRTSSQTSWSVMMFPAPTTATTFTWGLPSGMSARGVQGGVGPVVGSVVRDVQEVRLRPGRVAIDDRDKSHIVHGGGQLPVRDRHAPGPVLDPGDVLLTVPLCALRFDEHVHRGDTVRG